MYCDFDCCIFILCAFYVHRLTMVWSLLDKHTKHGGQHWLPLLSIMPKKSSIRYLCRILNFDTEIDFGWIVREVWDSRQSVNILNASGEISLLLNLNWFSFNWHLIPHELLQWRSITNMQIKHIRLIMLKHIFLGSRGKYKYVFIILYTLPVK